MRGRILLGCVGFAIACVLACSVRRLPAQSAGTSLPEAGFAISRDAASKPPASAQPSAKAEESLAIEIKLGDRQFSGDQALVPEDVFEVVFANASDRPLAICNPGDEIGWRQLSFVLIDLQSKRQYVVTRAPFARPLRQKAATSGNSHQRRERIAIQSHREYRYQVLLSDCQASDHDWSGLPSAAFGQRFSMTAHFEFPSDEPKKASHVWTGVLQSPSVNVRIANWQPHPPHYYLVHGFPAKALRLLMAEPFWISKRDDMRQTPLHIAASRGDVDVVRWLLDHGADVNATAYNNLTPLHITQRPRE